jgi:aerobic C4-dicarboxylate transport protein
MSEGRALTDCIGNAVATMVTAKWQGERDGRQVASSSIHLPTTGGS